MKVADPVDQSAPQRLPDDKQPDPYFVIMGRPSPNSGLILTRRGTVAFNYYLADKKLVTAESMEPLKPGQWTHVAVTVNYDKGAIKLYVNGGCTQTTDFARLSPLEPSLAERPLRLGVADPEAAEDKCRYQGLIDEVLIYSRALQDYEISTLYFLPAIRTEYLNKD